MKEWWIELRNEARKKAGTIGIEAGKNPKNLYLHQVEAIKHLNEKIHKQDHYAGLLVIPTGGGKTLTAVQWVLKNIIDQGKKVLWIAHRHELLNQALDAVVSNSYTDLLQNRKTFKYRVISGMHDRPVNIKADDDFIVASKDSIGYGIDYLVENWVKENRNDIFLVIDEAHHAVAKSYRNIINKLVDCNEQSFKILGLTATPFRTADNEKGLLKQVFKDDIAYAIDLKTLINREILADPIFIDSDTHIDMTCNLTDADIKKIHSSINLPEDIAEKITLSKERNNLIVNHYKQYQEKYGQTLVFALTITHAIQLKAIFEKNNIPCDYVVSAIKDMSTGVTISNEENAEKIKAFKDGKLKVLVNVNILTEGTDLPCVQTVLLTRPTTSTTLMTQMIGRALRGKKAGGTQYAYIVSFCDNWKDKIAWINPRLLYEDSRTFEETSSEKREHITRLIAISKMEEFAKMMDDTVDTSGLEKLTFIERIPVGIYSFNLLIPSVDEETDEKDEKHCNIMVYNTFKQAYEDFINDLECIFEAKELAEQEFLKEYELNYLCEKVKQEYFRGYDTTLCYKDEDIKDVLRYFAQTSAKPIFLAFEERENYDICKIANGIWNQDMNRRQEAAYLDELWNGEKSFLKIFFGDNKKFFITQINNELYNLSAGVEVFQESPTVTAEEIDLKKLNLWEIRKIDEKYWRKLVNAVWDKYRDEEGYYHSASGNFESQNKRRFQIDHIKPMSKGGLTELENLQLLTRNENFVKGDRYDEDIHEECVEEMLNDNDSGSDGDDEQAKEEDYRLGLVFFEEENYAKSEEYINIILGKNPDDTSKARALVLLGDIRTQQEEYTEALKFYDQGIELGLEDDTLYVTKGDILSEEMEEYDEALVAFGKALEINPENENIYCGMGWVYLQREEYNKALQDYNKALELNEELPVAHNNKGWCLKQLKMYDDVVFEFERAIELDPEFEIAYFNLAREINRKRQYKEAIEIFEKIITLNPQEIDSLGWIAYIYHRKLKDYQKALEYYDKVLEINPKYKWAINNREKMIALCE